MDILIPIAFALLGSILASFIGVLAERVGTGESWVRGRSRCNSCSAELRPADLVPIAAWLSGGGRAFCCGARLPISYVMSEVVLALSFYFAALTLPLGIALLVFLAALSTLLFIVLYDLRHMVVPREASAAFVILTALFAYLVTGWNAELGLTLVVAGGLGLLFYFAYAFSHGRIMGLGDSPVALGLALLVGAYAAIPGLVFSFWIGGLCGIIILARQPRGHRMGIEVPFVPFLALGFLLAYFTGWNPFLF